MRFLYIFALLFFIAITCQAQLQAQGKADRLVIFIWSEYIDPQIIKDFENRYGIKVRVDLYESNEEMTAKLQSGGLGQYDVIFPSTYFIPSLKNLNLIQKLDHSKLSNISNINPRFKNIAEDINNEYSIPYHWGTSGIALRSSMPEDGKKSWGLLYDAPDEINFVLLDTARDTIGAALKFLGYSLNTTNKDEIMKAMDFLIEVKKKKNFLGFDNGVGGLNKVLGYVAGGAQVYSGESIKASLEDPDVQYILPKEGGEMWVDLVAIAQNAPNTEGAYLFLNYLMEPEVAAKLSMFNNCATPIDKAKEFLPKELVNNAQLYPSEEVLSKFEYIKDLGEFNKLYDEAWVTIKTQ